MSFSSSDRALIELQLRTLALIKDRPVRIGLVGCSQTKAAERCAAEDLYLGALFVAEKAYAKKFCDDWLILSAKHGMLLPAQLVDPYDVSLKDLDRQGKGWAWGMNTAAQIIERYRCLGEVEFVGLASALYLTALAATLANRGKLHRPLEGRRIGEQKQWLAAQVRGAQGPSAAPRAV